MVDATTECTKRDPRLDEVISAYLQAVAGGQSPNRQELLARNPELAADLSAG